MGGAVPNTHAPGPPRKEAPPLKKDSTSMSCGASAGICAAPHGRARFFLRASKPDVYFRKGVDV